MTSKHTLAIIALAAAGAVPLGAAAQGAYVGAGLGTSEAREFCRGIEDCDKTGTAWRFFGGVRPGRNLAVEIGYIDLGRFTATAGGVTTRTESGAAEAKALLIYPVNQLSLYGMIGGYYATTKSTVDQVAGATKTTEKNGGLTYGLGAQYDFHPNWGARGEWQHYAKVGDSNTGGGVDVNTFTLSLLFRFR